MHVLHLFLIGNIFERAQQCQFYNQAVVKLRLYPKAELNTGKSIKVGKTEIQPPAGVSKTQMFSSNHINSTIQPYKMELSGKEP